MTTIVLHIGRGKTGTTELQHVLSRLRDVLASEGILYPRAGDDGGGHQRFAKSLLKSFPEWMEPVAADDDIQAQLAVELQNTWLETILISSENFTLVEPRLVFDYFNRILGLCEYRIVFFARTQDELVESQYNQDVKWCGVTASFDEYVEQELCDELDYNELLKPWANVFGQSSIHAAIYKSDSLLRDFFAKLGALEDVDHAAGLPDRRSGEHLYANASLGRDAVEVLRALNRYDISDRRAAYSDVVAALGRTKMPAVFFSSDQARRFRERFYPSNLLFSEAYLGHPRTELGGRRYSDEDRDRVVSNRRAMGTSASTR